MRFLALHNGPPRVPQSETCSHLMVLATGTRRGLGKAWRRERESAALAGGCLLTGADKPCLPEWGRSTCVGPWMSVI